MRLFTPYPTLIVGIVIGYLVLPRVVPMVTSKLG